MEAPIGRDLKKLDRMSISPDGGKMAFLGNTGYIHIASGSSKQWIMDIKMNCSAYSSTFLDENTLVTSGKDADIYLWDLRKSGRCLTRYYFHPFNYSTIL